MSRPLELKQSGCCQHGGKIQQGSFLESVFLCLAQLVYCLKGCKELLLTLAVVLRKYSSWLDPAGLRRGKLEDTSDFIFHLMIEITGMHRQRTSHLAGFLTVLITGSIYGQAPSDLASDVEAFVTQYCAECHGEDEPEARLTLTLPVDLQSILSQHETFERVLRAVEGGTMPPEDELQPPPQEIASFGKAIRELFEHAELAAEPDPGRVTMRRLNRTEYKNTVRDLFGVDFNPSEDFPNDGIGYGFDNIGDVLTMSPLLMERYLAAAESIVTRAIVPDPAEPLRHVVKGENAKPNDGDLLLEDEYRIIASNGSSPVETGPLLCPWACDENQEYVFRAKVYAPSETGPVKVAVLLLGDNQPASPIGEDATTVVLGDLADPFTVGGIYEIQTGSPEEAEVIRLDLPEMPVGRRVALALVQPDSEENPVRLFVKYLELEGPLDTRPTSHYKLLAHDPQTAPSNRTGQVVRRFLRRAYRRTPTDGELQRVVALAQAEEAGGKKWEESIQRAFQAVLCSPKFLFRVELDEQPQSPEIRPLDEFSLAARMSYFLWNSMPDDELLDLAEGGELTSCLDEQVQRMLADPKAQALAENFLPQWLQIQRLQRSTPDPEKFPDFDEHLRQAMFKETKLFFASVMDEDRSIFDLLDADYTFLNDSLARFYGMGDVDVGQDDQADGKESERDSEFRRVLLEGRQRGGLVTQASVLTVTSNPTRTSPVKRGRWVLEQLLGEPPPPPPPNVPELPEHDPSTATTLRQKLEIHRADPSCANCHAKMDAIGFALEHYDAIGAYREMDGVAEIDAVGKFADGTRFEGAEGLKAVLMENKALFSRCLTEKMLIYALGRGLQYYDRSTVSHIVEAVADDRYKFSALIREIVKSEPFLTRRSEPTRQLETNP